MTRYVSLAILMIVLAQPLSAQLYTIKTSTLDSLIYWGKKGKYCDTLSTSFEIRITALQNLHRISERLNTENASQIATLKAQIGNLGDQNRNQQELYVLDKSALKTKIKNQRRKILGLSGLSLVLFLALVL